MITSFPDKFQIDSFIISEELLDDGYVILSKTPILESILLDVDEFNSIVSDEYIVLKVTLENQYLYPKANVDDYIISWNIFIPVSPVILALPGINQNTITWNPVSDAVSYDLYWSLSPGVTKSDNKISGIISPYIHIGLTSGTTYYYVLVAKNDYGESDLSNEVSATPFIIPDVPFLEATAGFEQITLDWTTSLTALSYDLYWSLSPGVSKSDHKIYNATTPFIHTGLTPNIRYYYIAVAIGAGGAESISNEVSVVPYTVPVPPVISAEPAIESNIISWSDAPQATSYNLYWSLTPGVTKLSNKIAGVTSAYIHNGLTAHVTYFYVVTTVNEVGESNVSNEVFATPLPVPPPTGPFIYTIRTPDPSYAYRIPLSQGVYPSYTPPPYDFIVDWGDGSPTSHVVGWHYNDPNAYHVYSVAGDYTITINGTCGGFQAGYYGQQNILRSIVSFGYVHFNYLKFDNCANLVSLPMSESGRLTEVYSFGGSFSYCTSLTTLPAGLFFGCNTVTDFSYCFNGCTNLSYIPSTLFYYCDHVTNFYACFVNCPSLITLPNGLFSHCIRATNFYACFQSCSGLESIPSDLFTNCSAAVTFGYCFYACGNLTAIPVNLFKDLDNATDFQGVFNSCTYLETINSGIFDGCTAASNFSYMCESCTSLVNIPSGLFSQCTAAATFDAPFRNCTSLVTVPPNLWSGCTAASYMYGLFSGCVKLRTVSSGVFAHCTSINTFSSLFQNCTKLASILSDLFSDCVNLVNGSAIFTGCTSLSSVPDNLFSGLSRVTYFNEVFSGCTALTSIDSGMFSGCTSVTNFGNSFNNCSALTSIPSGLFNDCNSVIGFDNCFMNCGSLTGPAPELWLRHPTPTGSNCFYHDSGLSNFASIPGSWGGGGIGFTRRLMIPLPKVTEDYELKTILEENLNKILQIKYVTI